MEEKCKYCGEIPGDLWCDWDESDEPYEQGFLVYLTENGKLNVTFCGYIDDEREIKINYCPMCGRSLSDTRE